MPLYDVRDCARSRAVARHRCRKCVVSDGWSCQESQAVSRAFALTTSPRTDKRQTTCTDPPKGLRTDKRQKNCTDKRQFLRTEMR